jgi:hypothetical protein
MTDIQDMMNNGVVTMEEITAAWRQVAGDLNKSIDRKLFGQLNASLDDLIDTKEVGESPAGVEDVDAIAAADASSDSDSEGEGDLDDLEDVDVWDPSFDPMSVFDNEALAEITDFFIVAAGGMDGKIGFKAIANWDDIKSILSEGVLTEEALKSVWAEASRGKAAIDYDTFIRFNVRLDLVMDDLEAEAEAEEVRAQASAPVAVAGNVANKSVDSGNAADGDAEAFYRSEFKEVTGGGRLMRLDMLLEWKEISELIADGVIGEKQIIKMFEGMPKEPMGLPATSYGISGQLQRHYNLIVYFSSAVLIYFPCAENTFVAFNGMLDVLLDSAGSSDGERTVGSAPSGLVSEPARPMPSESELKMGSLGMDDESTTGLSEAELEMMEVLDKADNMLNSGSFGDFDQLIGDMNDPRLQALREKREGAEEVQGQLKDVITELLQLGRQQSRCGLDRPSEETAARIRDLTQAVIEKAPKAANRDINDIRKSINGKWKLMYTNSEMFNFYNGITGFANVFPTSKFEEVTMQYSSDGFLSEGSLYTINMATKFR